MKDLDLERRQIVVRDGKGAKDRVTMVPEKLVAALGEHLVAVRQQHEADVAAGYAGVWLPEALARKYSHGAGAFGARERGNDANLHACHAETGDWSAQSAGWVRGTRAIQPHRNTKNAQGEELEHSGVFHSVANSPGPFSLRSVRSIAANLRCVVWPSRVRKRCPVLRSPSSVARPP